MTKLSKASLHDKRLWKGYLLPEFDFNAVARKTREQPIWLHFGAGNLFRAFPAVLAQRLLNSGAMERGVITCEGYDDEIVAGCFRRFDDLTIHITLEPDGAIEKEVIASVTETLVLEQDRARIEQIFAAPSLQMATFTITEKGYALYDGEQRLLPEVALDLKAAPGNSRSFMARLTELLLHRMHSCGAPIALVSMDNCSQNGDRLRQSVLYIADSWYKSGRLSERERIYLLQMVSFPCTMIDKITPRPERAVAERLAADGLQDITPFITKKGTYIAPFVNAERPQYLVIEDDFPNGRPPLDQAGAIFTDRETVHKAERMKVSACLNPLQTALAVYGCLLGYTSIAAEMQDPELAALVGRLGREEGMPVVSDPVVLDPNNFLQEVLQLRLPNPYVPDTPQRIATDTSQKIAARFGYTIQSHGENACGLTCVPLVLAGWMRYLMAVDDTGKPFSCSADPLLCWLQEKMSGISLGSVGEQSVAAVRSVLSNRNLFGADLQACGLMDKTIGYWEEMTVAPGAVRAVLKKYMA